MRRHVLSLEDLQGFEAKTTLASSASEGHSKSLTIKSWITGYEEVISILVVEVDHAEVLRTESIVTAIEEYNKH